MGAKRYYGTWLKHDNEKKARVTYLLRNEVENIKPDTSENEAPPPVTRKRSFYDFEDEKKPESEVIKDVVSSYLESHETDVRSLDKFPPIKHIYRKVNVGLPSSASMERLFSYASQVFGTRRLSLLDSSFEQHLMLNFNKKFTTS